jgi:hypothetical protein
MATSIRHRPRAIQRSYGGAAVISLATQTGQGQFAHPTASPGGEMEDNQAILRPEGKAGQPIGDDDEGVSKCWSHLWLKSHKPHAYNRRC